MKTQSIIFLVWIFFIVCILTLALVDLESMFPKVNFAKSADLRHVLTFIVFVPFSKISFPQYNIIQILGISLLFAVGIEFAQELFTSGARNFTWSDLAYDLLGITIGVFGCLIIQRIRREKKINKK